MAILNSVKYSIRNIFCIFSLSVLILGSCAGKKENDSDNNSIETELDEEQNPKILGSDSPPNNPKTLGTDQEEQSSSALEGSEINFVEANRLLEHYLKLKNALVKNNNELAASEAGAMVELLLIKKR